jgi:uncharacterized protein (DUF1330 family)
MATPVYMVAMIDVKDYQAYGEQYGMPVARMFAEVGAEVLVATNQPDVLEGSWPGNWTVVVKVPSAEIARALYDSDEYAPFKKARIEQLTNETHFAILPGLGTGG